MAPRLTGMFVPTATPVLASNEGMRYASNLFLLFRAGQSRDLRDFAAPAPRFTIIVQLNCGQCIMANERSLIECDFFVFFLRCRYCRFAVPYIES